MLDTPIEYLKGVGPQKADLLKKELAIFTYGDLLQHYPFRYVDKTRFVRISEIEDDVNYVQVRGVLRNIQTTGEGRKKRLTGTLRDESGSLELVWFTGLIWLEKNLQPGQEYIVYGKPNEFNGRFNIAHPEMEAVTADVGQKPMTMQPVYPTTEKLKMRYLDSKGLMTCMKSLFTTLHPHRASFKETLPEYLLEKFRFPGRYDALLALHFPRNEEQLQKAKNRLKFEELFMMQLRLLSQRTHRQHAMPGYVFGSIGDYFNNFYAQCLPYELTNAQKRVLKEIRRDLGSGHQMNRLLQGDVGSGKTAIALMTMIIALDNGFQSALMAPTEILAQQHYNSLTAMLGDLGINIALLTGSVKGKKKQAVLEQLAAGEIHFIIGTHALIEDPVVFKNLGLVIVDEQHRFGVEQRARLWRKSATATPPHILVMTATPIPRTLAMTLYGDLDVSIIDELPPGRTPIKTMHKYDSHRLRVFGFMKEQIALGHQVYIVYPLIEESETLEDIKNLEAGVEAIEREFPREDYPLSIVHGRMKAADKDYEMQRFVRGETKIMIATSVIEVGVNVPNASCMVIENAERFGLSALHQLRGRVGRGAAESYCILMTSFKLTADGRERIDTMVRTTNGFEISEADLRLRGPGNIEGTQQSGLLSFRIADLAKDERILVTAREIAQQILDDDPTLTKPEHKILHDYLALMRKTNGWGKIS